MLDALVLLAGFSRRMGQPKQHSSLAGKTFLKIVADKLNTCRNHFRHLIFVGQQNDTVARQLVNDCDGIWLCNEQPELGPLHSIRTAINSYNDATAKLLWPIDHPMVSVATLQDLLKLWCENRDQITIPSTGERRGHPSIFPGWCNREFFNLDLERGAKQLLHLYPERINYLLTTDPWIIENLNTPEALAKAENWLQANQAQSLAK